MSPAAAGASATAPARASCAIAGSADGGKRDDDRVAGSEQRVDLVVAAGEREHAGHVARGRQRARDGVRAPLVGEVDEREPPTRAGVEVAGAQRGGKARGAGARRNAEGPRGQRRAEADEDRRCRSAERQPDAGPRRGQLTRRREHADRRRLDGRHGHA